MLPGITASGEQGRTLRKLTHAASEPFPARYTQMLKKHFFEEAFLKFMMRRSPLLAFILLMILLPTMGCLFRTRPVEDQYSKAPLKDSTQQALIDSIDQQAAAIRTLKATVDIDSAAGGIKRGTQTQYKEIRGFVLARKPGDLHMTGLMPFVRTKAFDMVSNGQDFKLWIPPKNKFVIGQNQVTIPSSDQPMENIRPQNIYEALLIKHIDPDTEIAVLEPGYETLHDSKGHRILQDDYILTVINTAGGTPRLARKIIFDRTDLRPHEQVIYENGKISTDAKYAEYKDYGSVSFPSRIEIYRPQEEVDITLNVLKLDFNTPLTDDQFVLEQPDGAQVIHLDRPQSTLVVPPAERH
jgi:outer membrane lipoprotein-sorting protein